MYIYQLQYLFVFLLLSLEHSKYSRINYVVNFQYKVTDLCRHKIHYKEHRSTKWYSKDSTALVSNHQPLAGGTTVEVVGAPVAMPQGIRALSGQRTLDAKGQYYRLANTVQIFPRSVINTDFKVN